MEDVIQYTAILEALLEETRDLINQDFDNYDGSPMHSVEWTNIGLAIDDLLGDDNG
jgi:hypothetical protein